MFDVYCGVLFLGVEVFDNDFVWLFSVLFLWGNGVWVMEKVLGDLLKFEVRAASFFVSLYDYYCEYGGVYNLGVGLKWFVVVSDLVVVWMMFKD